MPRQKLGIETRGLGRSRSDKLEGKRLYLCHHTHKHYSFELLNLLQTRVMNMDGEY